MTSTGWRSLDWCLDDRRMNALVTIGSPLKIVTMGSSLAQSTACTQAVLRTFTSVWYSLDAVCIRNPIGDHAPRVDA